MPPSSAGSPDRRIPARRASVSPEKWGVQEKKGSSPEANQRQDREDPSSRKGRVGNFLPSYEVNFLRAVRSLAISSRRKD